MAEVAGSRDYVKSHGADSGASQFDALYGEDPLAAVGAVADGGGGSGGPHGDQGH
jgi:hypothetical protein